jgi:acetyltransferase-like isoleucine patch superfamily enzyme
MRIADEGPPIQSSKMRQFIKMLVYLFAIAIVSPLGWAERFARKIAGRDVWFECHGDLLSLVPGKFGRYLRNSYYWITLENCPLNCCFLFGMSFTHSGVSVGQRVYVGSHSLIGLARLGDDTLVGDHVHVLSGKQQHHFSDETVRIQDQPQSFTMISIGKNCWLGTNCVVMDSVGDNCVIGASSVVTHAIPDNSIAVGNPARVLRTRPRARPAT